MMYASLLLSTLLIIGNVCGDDLEFLFRHKISGQILTTYPVDIKYLMTYGDVPSAGSAFTFESVDGQWGYLRNQRHTNHLLCPIHHNMHPNEGSQLVVEIGEHPYNLFALDQVNNRIIHHGGKHFHVRFDQVEPEDYTDILLTGYDNEYQEFEIISPYGHIVYPYGDAAIIGNWVLVFSVVNAMADHTYQFTVSIGKSVTESTSDSFQFVWEGSVGAQAWFAQMSSSTSLTDAIEHSSSETWSAEVTESHTIAVHKGQSMATWQLNFVGEQLGHKAVHQSKMYHDTEGPNVKPPNPGDYMDIKYYTM